MKASAATPQQAEQINRLAEQNRQIVQQSLKASVKVATQLQDSQAVVAQARETLGVTPKLAVILGADKNLAEAQAESRYPILIGLTNVGLYLRQGYYRTVALADTQDQADAMLKRARQRSPKAYVVNFDKWCPKRESQHSYTVCVEQ